MRFFRLPLAMAAFLMICYGFSTVSADELEVTGYGDSGVTSYASEYGQAEFEIVITSVSGDHSNVQASAEFNDDWSGDSEFTDCNGNNFDNASLDDGETLTICFSATIPEDSDSPIEVLVSVESDETSGDEMYLYIVVSDWFVYSEDEVKEFTLGTTRAYAISVENIKVDENGDSTESEETIELNFQGLNYLIDDSWATDGNIWAIQSDDESWDPMNQRITIDGLDSDQTRIIIFELTLVQDSYSSSYLDSNSFAIWLGYDESSGFQTIFTEVIVLDRFNISVLDSGNRLVNNGCSDDKETVEWSLNIKNSGNTFDSFDVSFDTSDAESVGWDVDGATNFNTNQLEPDSQLYSHSVTMNIPGGLEAGTSHGFTMTVHSVSDADVSHTASFTGTVQECSNPISISANHSLGYGNPGSMVEFTITVVNNGNADKIVSFEASGPTIWSPMLSENEITLSVGSSGIIIFSLTVPADSEAGRSSGMAVVECIGGCSQSQLTFEAVSNQIFDISLAHPSGSNGVVTVTQTTQVQLTLNVTNNGNGIDTLSLSMTNAPAWASLSPETLTIGRGQTVTIIINLSPDTEALSGRDYTFQVVATSSSGAEWTSPDMTVNIEVKETVNEEPVEEANSGISYSINFTEDIVHVDVSPEASSQGCNEMVVSNEGQATIDVDVALNGGGVTISPGHVSVTLAPGGKITESICALALKNSPERIVYVSARAEGRETNTQLTPVHVTSNFTVEISNSANTTEDTTSKGEDYEGDEAGECSDEADNDKDGLFDCDDDTCAGSPACKATDSTEGLSSLSFVPALISIGLIARYRRK